MKTKNTKILALILAMLLALSLFTACGNEPGTVTPAPDATNPGAGDEFTGGSKLEADESDIQAALNAEGPMELTIGILNDVGSFYPGGAGTSGTKTKRVMLYETLFFKDAEKQLHPLLAKSYEDKGNSTYAIELFDYITDSAGNHLTAADVIFSIDLYIKDGQNSSTWATISDYHATGDYTFEVTFAPEVTGQLGDFLSRVPMITQAAWEASPDEMAFSPVGTSGYTLNTAESVLGSIYIFEKRDDYWQTDEQYICDHNRNNLDKLTAKVITDASTLAVALETGEIDFTTDIDAKDRALFADMTTGAALDGYVKLDGQNNAFVHLTFNCGEKSPCRDIKLRQAICHAIDAAACKFTAYSGFGGVCNAATNPNLSDSGTQFGHDDYFTYDVELAKQLVAESGYNGETLRMLVLPNATIKASVPLIKQYCAEIGVTLESLEYDMAEFRKVRTETTGEVYDIELLGATSADDTVYVSVKEIDDRAYANGLGRIFVKDEELQKLYEDAGNAATTSPEIIQSLLDRLEEQCYMYGLYYCPKMIFGRDCIKSATVIPFDDAIYPSFVVSK